MFTDIRFHCLHIMKYIKLLTLMMLILPSSAPAQFSRCLLPISYSYPSAIHEEKVAMKTDLTAVYMKQKALITVLSKGLAITTFKDIHLIKTVVQKTQYMSMITLEDIADRRCTSASKRPIKLCHVQKLHTRVELRGKEGYSSHLKEFKERKKRQSHSSPFSL